MNEYDDRASLTFMNGTSGHQNQSAAAAADHNINVVIRVRPIITPKTLEKSKVATGNSRQDDIDADQPTAITFPAAGQIQVKDTISNSLRSFAFNVVFEPEATQEEVFEHSGVKRLIDMALDGFACTVFAYGQTSTGKTYTLTGNVFQNVQERNESCYTKRSGRALKITDDHEYDDSRKQSIKNIGIVQLSFAYLFEQIKRRQLRDKTLYVITVSYLEVYNEQVLDLLNPSPRSLNVRWAKDRGFYAENLFKVECEDLGDLEGVLEEGCKNRQVRSHSMNENSSRSHSVMTITLSSEMSDPEDPQGFIHKEGRLCLVDLAGSEKTKRTNSKGGTFVEANNINRSLLVLGNCIACLADPKRRNGHIPYRDSTLTKLLADSLSGNGMTLMETISTLRYASRAKRVRMNPVVQMDPRELLILSLKREVRLLRMENNYLRQNLGPNAAESLQQNMKIPSITTDNGNPTSESNIDKSNHETLLTKYMRENEVLRVENVELNLQRNRLVRDHELVCRENEHLLKKFQTLISKLNPDAKSSSIASIHSVPAMFSSASSPSILAMSPEDEFKKIPLLQDKDNDQTSEHHFQQQQQALKGDSTNQVNKNEEPDDNGLMIIRQRRTQQQSAAKANIEKGPEQHTTRVSSKTTYKVTEDTRKPNGGDLEQTSMLDLTIRGKSAVNSSRFQPSNSSTATTRRR